MVKKFIKSYYKLLDEKLENWTLVVILIALLIVSAAIITKEDTNAWVLVKSSLLEAKKINPDNIIEINWIKYQIVLEEY